LFDLKSEPKTYEEIVARARHVRAKLGITTAPKPVTLQSCKPLPKPERAPPRQVKMLPPLPPLSEEATKAMRSVEMDLFLSRNHESSKKAVDWFLKHIEKWVEVQNIGRPNWVDRLIRNFCFKNGIPPILMFSGCRMPEVVNLRGELWAEIRNAPQKPSVAQIGRWFKRDHTTVLYGIVRHTGGDKHPMVIRKRKGHAELDRKRRQQRQEERREALKAAVKAWDASRW
jgi:hypothetical protein